MMRRREGTYIRIAQEELAMIEWMKEQYAEIVHLQGKRLHSTAGFVKGAIRELYIQMHSLKWKRMDKRINDQIMRGMKRRGEL
jgi:hypothetical protein